MFRGDGTGRIKQDRDFLTIRNQWTSLTSWRSIHRSCQNARPDGMTSEQPAPARKGVGPIKKVPGPWHVWTLCDISAKIHLPVRTNSGDSCSSFFLLGRDTSATTERLAACVVKVGSPPNPGVARVAQGGHRARAARRCAVIGVGMVHRRRLGWIQRGPPSNALDWKTVLLPRCG